MGENDKKEEKKDKLFCKRDIVIIVITLLASIVLIFFIAVAVKINEGKEWISLEGWLAYYGSIGGAMFGGYITAIGLYITFRINNKQLEEQRKIDNERWEDSNRQFNQQMKMQIINERIKDYTLCREEINRLIEFNRELNIELSRYKNDLWEFTANIVILLDYGLKEKTFNVDFKTQFLKFSDQYVNFKNQSNKVKISIQCILEEEIHLQLKKAEDIIVSIKYFYEKVFEFNCLENISDTYDDYIDKDGNIDFELINEFNKIDIIIDECIGELEKIENLLSDCIVEMPKLIGKLYEEKYSLNNINNEQKTSNNI